MSYKWNINVRPELWSDYRFRILERKIGCRYAAIGRLVEFWSEAQRYWVEGNPIPDYVINAIDGMPIIEAGFGEQVDGGYRAKGDDEAFGWIKKKKEMGRKSAESRLKKYGTTRPIVSEQNTNSGSQSLLLICPNKDLIPENEISPVCEPTFEQGTTNASSENSVPEPNKRIEEKRIEYKTIPPFDPPASGGAASMRPQDLMTIWNENCGSLPKVKRWTTARQRSAAARIKEHSVREDWVKLAQAIAGNNWCNGANDRKWLADFEYFTRQRTIVRLIEGTLRDWSEKKQVNCQVEKFDFAEVWNKYKKGNQ